MNRVCLSFATAAVLTGMSFAQTSADAQAGASAAQSTSVQANRSGAQAQSQESGQASAQSALSHGGKSSSASAASSNQLASGTAIRTTLEKPVDTRKAKPGDQVVARTTDNVKSDGKVVIPKGSRMFGHVTQAQAAGKGQSSSQLGIAFDRAVLKNGQDVPLHASIQSIAAAQSSASADMMGDTMADGAMAGGGTVASGRGAVGGAVRAVGTGGGSLVNTASSATGSARSTLGGSGAALSSSGQLLSSSHGVVGMNGLALASQTTSAAQGSLITSRAGSVHLDSGTQMILQVTK